MKKNSQVPQKILPGSFVATANGQDPGPRRRRRRPILYVVDVLILAMAVTGIYLIARPTIVHMQQDQLSSQLLEMLSTATDDDETEATILLDPNALIVDGEDLEYVEAYEDFSTSQSTTLDPANSDPTASGPTAAPTAAPAKVVVKAIGRIQIPRISLTMPIAEGATIYNLRVAIGHYTPSAPLGQPGRTVLFGHRMYTYGRHFNRLNEMEVGDTIVIEDKKNRYTYTVDQIDRILPADLLKEIYAPVTGSRIMLVTCDPIRVASHRLLVKGVLTATESLK
jgi:sortase A